MIFKKVIIKQIADADNKTAAGLERYNRSRFPRCTDVFHAALLPDGRFVTGLDPNGYELQLIKDDGKRERIKQERIALVNNLQSMLPNANISPTSPFWENFPVIISADQNLILSSNNPIDVLKYHLLTENGFVAPSKEDVGSPRYRDAQYYCSVEEVEEQEKVSTQKLRDRARMELVKMAENKDYMLLIGKYLEGTKYKETMKPDTLYGNLSYFIDDPKNPENAEKFLKAVTSSKEDLQFKVTIDTALRKKLIKYINGQYTWGRTNLGKSANAVVENLKLPEFAAEFTQIYDEVNGI